MIAVFSLNSLTGFEPGSSAPDADRMSNAPRRRPVQQYIFVYVNVATRFAVAQVGKCSIYTVLIIKLFEVNLRCT
jgi:hypothetical protein